MVLRHLFPTTKNPGIHDDIPVDDRCKDILDACKLYTPAVWLILEVITPLLQVKGRFEHVLHPYIVPNVGDDVLATRPAILWLLPITKIIIVHEEYNNTFGLLQDGSLIRL